MGVPPVGDAIVLTHIQLAVKGVVGYWGYRDGCDVRLWEDGVGWVWTPPWCDSTKLSCTKPNHAFETGVNSIRWIKRCRTFQLCLLV
jgi:hypothetical protein